MLRKRGGVYHYDFQIRGERFRGTTGTGDKLAAQELHDQKKAEAWRRFVKNERLFTEAALSYFEGREKKGSYTDDLRRLKVLLEWCKDKFVADINPELGQTIRTGLQLRGLGNSTVNRYLVLLIAILNHAADMQWIDNVPRIKKLKETQGRIEYLTPEEVNRLLDAFNDQVHKDFVLLAIATGMRMRNLTHLEWDNVDLFRRTITVNADSYKSGRVYVAPINNMAMDVLKRLHRPLGRVLQYKGRDLDAIGTRAFKTAQKRAGITKNIHPHLFRHTFASWHVMNGTSLGELKELGGWSKLESVLIYAHLNLDHLQKSSAKIQEALSI